MREIMGALVADGVTVVARPTDIEDAAAWELILPSERPIVAAAVPNRRREFAVSRSAAREALRGFGLAPVAIGRGERGEPLWPTGFKGSLTHTEGWAAAAVTRASVHRSVGIDIERARPLPPGVAEYVLRPEEQQWLEAVELDSAWRAAPLSTVIFSAKESVYKTWFPLTHRWLGFEEATVTLTGLDAPGHYAHAAEPDHGALAAQEGPTGERVLAQGRLTAQIHADGTTLDGGSALSVLVGRWCITQNFVATAITL